MNLFRKDRFKGVPGPSPWYLRTDAPTLTGFKWNDAGNSSPFAGKMVLEGGQGAVAVFDFYNYISVFDEHTLLVWYQSSGTPRSESPSSPPVRLLLLNLLQLRPLAGDLRQLSTLMGTNGVPLLINGEPLAAVNLDTSVVGADQSVMFPEQFRRIDEILILCDSSGIHLKPGCDSSDLALLIAHPRRSIYHLYPQDWFNSGGFDYGYQWVTRVVRNPKNRSHPR